MIDRLHLWHCPVGGQVLALIAYYNKKQYPATRKKTVIRSFV